MRKRFFEWMVDLHEFLFRFQMLSNGIVGKILDFFGSVSILASRHNSKEDPSKSEDELKNKRKRKTTNIARRGDAFQPEKAVVACVLYVSAAKHVALSTNPYLWHKSQRLETLLNYKVFQETTNFQVFHL